MTDDELAAVHALMARYGVGTLIYEEGNTCVSLIIAAPAIEPVATEPGSTIVVLADATGRFLARHPSSMEEPLFPRHVETGDIVGWLKTGALLRPIVARESGIIGQPLVAVDTLIGYGDRVY